MVLALCAGAAAALAQEAGAVSTYEAAPMALLEELAAEDDVEAMGVAGLRYMVGNGVPADMGRAGEWFLLAAEHGSETGMVAYAVVYLLIFQQDIVTLDDESGDFQLREYWEPFDADVVELAFAWLNIAAVCGTETIVKLRDELFDEFSSPGELERAQSRSTALYEGVLGEFLDCDLPVGWDLS
ncbi:MAG: hypothetical protein OXC31_29405 [Spirochaetaceae bacterium]|nr:hypothetical protein [Spirochaetaceae bacterium]